MDVLCQAPTIDTAKYGEVSQLDVSASYDETTQKMAVFIVNRAQTGQESVNIRLQDFDAKKTVQVYQVSGNDPKVSNTFNHPNAIKTVDLGHIEVIDQGINLQLPALSFTVIVG